MSLISAGQMVGQMATFGGGILRTLRLLTAEPVGDGESDGGFSCLQLDSSVQSVNR